MLIFTSLANDSRERKLKASEKTLEKTFEKALVKEKDTVKEIKEN
jgi:RNA polymerase-interacting CarD/CdnL/TRCF family regulator